MNNKNNTNINDFFEVFKAKISYKYKNPIYSETIQAGFPSPASDYIEQRLDLNDFLIKHPSATFFVKAKGDSMIDAGIHDGDILIVDKALEPKNNSIIIAVINSEFTVKRFRKIKDDYYLIPENINYKAIKLTEDMDFMVWGVVTNVIHELGG